MSDLLSKQHDVPLRRTTDVRCMIPVNQNSESLVGLASFVLSGPVENRGQVHMASFFYCIFLSGLTPLVSFDVRDRQAKACVRACVRALTGPALSQPKALPLPCFFFSSRSRSHANHIYYNGQQQRTHVFFFPSHTQ